MAITMKQASEYYDLGVIKEVNFVRGLTPGTWQVLFVGEAGRAWDLKTAHGNDVREFKTLDFAVKVVEEIGFRISSLKVCV